MRARDDLYLDAKLDMCVCAGLDLICNRWPVVFDRALVRRVEEGKRRGGGGGKKIDSFQLQDVSELNRRW